MANTTARIQKLACDTAQHAYDLYTFTNGPTPACVTITTTTSCGTAAANQIITVAYLGSFNPANPCTLIGLNTAAA